MTEITTDPLEQIKALIEAAGPNAAELKFPTDKWGFTSEVKKAVLKAASSVRGNEEKQKLLLGTLAVLQAHIRKRYPRDRDVAKARLTAQEAAHNERLPRERVSSYPVNTVKDAEIVREATL